MEYEKSVMLYFGLNSKENKLMFLLHIDDAPGTEELHRQAIFSTAMKPMHDHYKITASCK
jgi:hypothetical protein